jgi:glucans biosynthesis protein
MVQRRWRALWLTTVLLVAALAPNGPVSAQPPGATPSVSDQGRPFDHQWLVAHARDLATRPFAPRPLADDNPLRALNYDQHRLIQFDPAAAIWREEPLPFQLQLFHPGFLHNIPVGIHLVSNGSARELPFSPGFFDYSRSQIAIDPADVGGYAGFRVHYPINTPTRHEEFLVFLGSSYFRAVGKDQFYGLSARGLAVNTVGPGGEEFPLFSDFWIERPVAGAREITIHALLDSQSVSGAYRFRAIPGVGTRLEVEAVLFPRRDLPQVGIGALTSMFLFDTTNRHRFDDYRNAVHDSDGLLILQTNGEQVWRPLINPRQVQVSLFGSAMPAGFGLLQRHQDFVHFNDDEARYDKRTSLWIEPLDDWGQGHVELVEIPTDEEINDNIVAYWQPAEGLSAGNEYRFRYRMTWGSESPVGAQPGRIIDTAAGAVDGSEERVFAIDYSGGAGIPGVSTDPDAVRILATTSAGTISSVSGTLVGATGNYRAYVKLDPVGIDLAELRVTLEVGGSQWGETWLYRWAR